MAETGGKVKSLIKTPAVKIVAAVLVVAVAVTGVLVGANSAQGLSGRTSSIENTGIYNYESWDCWREHAIHKIGDTWCYCVHDGPNYHDGENANATEGNAVDYLGQDLLTELALVYDYVWNKDMFRTPGGERLANDYQRHAVTQCAIRAYCIRDGLLESFAFHANCMYVGKHGEGGTPLTGWSNIPGTGIAGKEASASMQAIYDYVAANKANYVGHGEVAKGNVNQEVLCNLWLESKGGYAQVVKTGTTGNAALDARVANNSYYDLSGAEFTLYNSKNTNDRAKNVDGNTFVLTVARQSDGTYATNVENLAAGTYYVRETKGPNKGYQRDTDGDGTPDAEDANPTDYWRSITVTNETEDAPAQITWNNPPFFPTVDLTKYTSQADMNLFNAVKNNPCYDILGAQFTLYETNGTIAKDINGNNVVLTVTSSEEQGTVGKTNRVKILPGDYWLRETKAPNKGFRLDADGDGIADEHDSDTSGHKNITVKLEDQTFTWTNPPMYDPTPLYLYKRDANTGEYFKIPQGDADLNGAQYRISYYKGVYTRASDLPSTPDATAVWTTHSYTLEGKTYSGMIDLAFDAPTSGTWKYHDDIADVNYAPLGTLVIQEIEPPTGYLIDSNKYIVSNTDDGTHLIANILEQPYNQDGTPGNEDWTNFFNQYQLNGDQGGIVTVGD